MSAASTGRKAEFQAIVMAGGNGSRLQPVSRDIARPLVPIGNVPSIGYTLAVLERCKVDDVIIIAQENAVQPLLEYIREVLRFRIKVHIEPVPNDTDMGTADALRLVKDKIYTDFLVVPCDLLLGYSLHRLADTHRINNAAVTCLLAPAPPKTPDQSQRRAVHDDTSGLQDYIGLDPASSRILCFKNEADVLDDESISFRRTLLNRYPAVNIRLDLVDLHVYLFAKWVVDFVVAKDSIRTIKGELVPYLIDKQFAKPNPNKVDPLSFLPPSQTAELDLLCDSIVKERNPMGQIFCAAHIVSPQDSTQDAPAAAVQDDSAQVLASRVNTLTSYADTAKTIAKHIGVLLQEYPFLSSPLIHSQATIADKTTVGGDSMVGNDTTIGERCSIKRSVVGAHCRIGDKCKLSNCIVLDHVTVGPGTTLSNCIVCHDANVAAACKLSSCIVGQKMSVNEGEYKNTHIVAEEEISLYGE